MYNLFSSGLKTWVFQRLTALFISFYLVGLLIFLSINPVQNYLEWRILASGPWFQTTSFLFLFCLLYHSWVGLRDVIIDYAPSKLLKLIKLTSLLLWIAFLFLWGTYVLILL